MTDNLRSTMSKKPPEAAPKDRCIPSRLVERGRTPGRARLWLASTTLFTVLASGSGCAPAPTDCEGPSCGCDARAGSGSCCEAFLEPAIDGQCVARAWPPTVRVSLGEPGADGIELAVDGLGRALVGWRRRISEDPFARSILAEQTSQGWRTHVLGPADAGTGGRVTLASHGLETWVTWSQQRRTPEGEDASAVFLWRRAPTGQWLTTAAGERLSFEPKAYEPRPLLPSTGEGFVVWNQWRQDGGYGVAVGRRGPGGPLRLPNTADDVVSPHVFFSNAPQLAVADNGDAIIAWYQATPPPGSSSPDPVSDGLRLFVSERTGPDGRFSKPAIEDWISPEGPPLASHGVRNPVVAIGDFGQALVFWSQEHPSGAVGLYLATRTGKREWTTPVDIDDTFGPLREFATCIDVAISKTREAHVTWFDGPPGATQVYAAHRDDAGKWDVPRTRPLSTPGRTAQDPRVAVGPNGEVALLWTERGTDGRWRVMGRRRGPNTINWSDSVELSLPEEGDALEGEALGPTVAIGPDGTLVAAWTAGPLGAQTVSVSILP